MTEKAKILKVENDIAIVECHPSSDCEGCGRCGRQPKQIKVEATNSKGLALHEGDMVQIFMSPSRAIAAAFIVLIVPLLMFVLFFSLSGQLLDISEELPRVGLGLVGVAAGFLLGLPLKNRYEGMPEITHVLESGS